MCPPSCGKESRHFDTLTRHCTDTPRHARSDTTRATARRVLIPQPSLTHGFSTTIHNRQRRQYKPSTGGKETAIVAIAGRGRNHQPVGVRGWRLHFSTFFRACTMVVVRFVGHVRQ
ncbi:unnamed protein product, partial [Brenthis ino]